MTVGLGTRLQKEKAGRGRHQVRTAVMTISNYLSRMRDIPTTSFPARVNSQFPPHPHYFYIKTVSLPYRRYRLARQRWRSRLYSLCVGACDWSVLKWRRDQKTLSAPWKAVSPKKLTTVTVTTPPQSLSWERRKTLENDAMVSRQRVLQDYDNKC